MNPDPHTLAMFAAGHDNEHEDSILDLMEVYGADEYEERDGFLYLYRGGEYLTTFERKR